MLEIMPIFFLFHIKSDSKIYVIKRLVPEKQAKAGRR